MPAGLHLLLLSIKSGVQTQWGLCQRRNEDYSNQVLDCKSPSRDHTGTGTSFIHSFVCSFLKCALSIYNVSGTVQGSVNSAVNAAEVVSTVIELAGEMGKCVPCLDVEYIVQWELDKMGTQGRSKTPVMGKAVFQKGWGGRWWDTGIP